VSYLQYPIKTMATIFPSSEYWRAALLHSDSLAAGNDSFQTMFSGENGMRGAFSLNNSLQLLSLPNMLAGIGFGKVSSLLGVADDHVFIFQFMWQLGIPGFIGFVSILIRAFFLSISALKSVDPFREPEAMLLVSLLILVPFGLVHSGVFMRKACWILLCFVLALGFRLEKKTGATG